MTLALLSVPLLARARPVTTSPDAVLLRLEFDGELVTTRRASPDRQVRAQLLYTIGLFNGIPGGARLDHLQLTNVILDPLPEGWYRIRYHARLPVAWGDKARWPATLPLAMPRRIDVRFQETFVRRYARTCIDPEDAGHRVTTRNFWFYYRPRMPTCVLSADDAATFQAKVTVSPEAAQAQSPDYDRIWSDNSLDVVVIFAKDSPGGGVKDEGVITFNQFIAGIRAAQPNAVVTPARLGPIEHDVTLQERLPDGRSISVAVLLVDSLESAPVRFEERYGELTPGADLIIYSGHAGLGKNIRRFSEMGQFLPGKYQIVMLDGCDTFAYGDGELIERRHDLNPDDPDGSLYLDLLTNAMPASFDGSLAAPLTLIKALLDRGKPRTYGQVFREADSDGVVMVTGARHRPPSMSPEGPWVGFERRGILKRGREVVEATPFLRPGTYEVVMTPDPAFAGGHAELRVRVGAAPPARPGYRCPAYGADSNARCVITLSDEAAVFARVTGLGPESRFILRVYRRL